MRVWSWLKGLISLHRMTRAERKYHQWRHDAERLGKSMDRQSSRLRAVKSQLVVISESVAEDLEDSRLAMERQADVVNELNAELEILKDTTVPGLVDAVMLIREQLKADTAIQVSRHVASMPQERE